MQERKKLKEGRKEGRKFREVKKNEGRKEVEERKWKK